MVELTDEQKEQSQKVLDGLMNYFWAKIKTKMIEGETFDEAIGAIMKEILND